MALLSISARHAITSLTITGGIFSLFLPFGLRLQIKDRSERASERRCKEEAQGRRKRERDRERNRARATKAIGSTRFLSYFSRRIFPLFSCGSISFWCHLRDLILLSCSRPLRFRFFFHLYATSTYKYLPLPLAFPFASPSTSLCYHTTSTDRLSLVLFSWPPLLCSFPVLPS